jgi:dolichol-phosphate mannosyltransferase
VENTGIVIPTLNEEGNIEELLRNILILYANMKIVVVDDQSQDLTVPIIQKLVKQFPDSIHLIAREEKINGLAGAYIEGYTLCLSLGLNWIFQMDADGQHDPKDMLQMWKLRAKKRLVIGSRYCAGGKIEGWNKFRVLISRMGNVYFRLLHRPGVHDCTGGYKLFDGKTLSQTWSIPPSSKGFTFHAETTYRWKADGNEIVEVPITFRAREGGDSKMTFSSAIESIKQIFLWKI